MLGFRWSWVVREAADMAVALFILLQERTFADALAIRLEREPDMDVVATLDINALPSRLLVGSQVDVVLLDADLADDTAFRLGQELSQAPDAPRVIFLGHSDDPERIVRGIRVGAVGWVRKDESLDRLIRVIRGVARGETWLPPDQIGEVLRLLMRGPDHDEDGDQLLAALTGREREVLFCLAEGNRRCDVAEHLHMSPNTVRTHLQNLMGKLGVHTALEAVALTCQVLDADSPDRGWRPQRGI
ncbi:MAG TPA: response regulator transcription factor [Streptosporangiaceae bacterium]